MSTNEIVTIAGSIIGAIGVVGGIVGRYLGKLLSNRTQEAIDRYRLSELEKRMDKFEEEQRDERRSH